MMNSKLNIAENIQKRFKSAIDNIVITDYELSIIALGNNYGYVSKINNAVLKLEEARFLIEEAKKEHDTYTNILSKEEQSKNITEDMKYIFESCSNLAVKIKNILDRTNID